MLFLVEDASAAMCSTLPALTKTASHPDGMVRAVTDVPGITAWLKTFNMGLGEDGIAKPALEAMLDREDLPKVVRQVLTIRQDGGKASVSKYQALFNRISDDTTVKGALVYCGAASTGRWSSRGVQLHNLVRAKLLKKLATVERMIATLKQGATLAEFEDLHGPAMPIAGEMLRPVIIAHPGHWLVRGDSKQIEARVGPWLAGAQWKLDAFERYDTVIGHKPNGDAITLGPDTYKVSAAGIYHCSPDDIDDEDPRRQIGKVSDLSLQFQGGCNALQMMAKNYKAKIPRFTYPAGLAYEDRYPPPEGTDEWIVQLWREANPEIKAAWKLYEDAAIRCMECEPGQEIPATQYVSFKRNANAIRMRLPSGTPLYYRQPQLERVKMPWGKYKQVVTFWAEDAQSKQWRKFFSYGGLWFQNSVQGFARDLMGYWQLQFEAVGILPTLNVHDEGIGEAPFDLYPRAEDAVAAILKIMRTKPGYARGLPVNADASAAPRYVKG
jgi:DNA polymerase